MGVQFAGNILVQSNGGPLPISQGGTGQTTATGAVNALLPVQTGNSGKVLTTNGTNISWENIAGQPGGADAQIQYNDSGTFGGNSFLTINKSTGAITSTSTLTNNGLIITGDEATARSVKLQTAGSDRWIMQANAVSETGASAGSDFELVRYADNGLTFNVVYSVARNSGVVDFKVAPTINGNPISATVSASSLTGTTLASNVVSSSLTSVGTLSTLSVSGTHTQTGAFNLAGSSSPVQVAGSAGTAGQVLTSAGAGATPTWTTPSSGNAGTLTGTTLASNVVSSSLTSVGTLTSLNVSGNVGFGGTTTPQQALSVSLANNTPSIEIVPSNSTPIIQSWHRGSGVYSQLYLDASNFAVRTGSGASPTLRLTIDSSGTWLVNGSAGTSGQVLTSAGAGATPTWQTPSGGAAGTLTGTTLASNVVSSSLTSVGTLTSLNVSGATTLTGTTQARGALITATTNSGVSIGADSGYPGVLLTASGSALNQKHYRIYTDVSSGQISHAFVNDAYNSSGIWQTVTRSGTTATDITFTSTAFNLAVGTGGLKLNGSAGTSGQVLTSNGPSAAPTWGSAPSPTTLSATGTYTYTTATTGVYQGVIASSPYSLQVCTAASSGQRAWSTLIDAAGTWYVRAVNDNNTASTDAISITRAGTAIGTIKLTGAAINLAVGTQALQLNGAPGTSGQVLTSQGASAAPIWTTPGAAASALTGTTLASNVVSSSLTSVGTLTSLKVSGNVGLGGTTTPQQPLAIALANNVPTIEMVPSNSLPVIQSWNRGTNVYSQLAFDISNFMIRTGAGASPTLRLTIDSSGAWLINGTAGTSGQVLTSAGAGATPTWQTPSGGAAGTLTGTTLASNVVSSSLTSVGTLSALAVTGTTTQTGALNLAGTSSPLQLAGSAGTSGQVLMSAGAGATPTWGSVTSTSTLPRVTSITSAVVGKRAAVSTNQTITATTWAGGGSIAVGDIFSIYNDSGSAITISAGAGLTMYKDGTATGVSSVTLAARGSCTVWYNTVTEVVINGSIV